MKTIIILLALLAMPFTVSAQMQCGSEGFPFGDIFWPSNGIFKITCNYGYPAAMAGQPIEVRQTNWTVNTFYTNTTTGPVIVSTLITNTSVLVAGVVGMDLEVGSTTNSATTYVADSRVFSTSSSGGLVSTSRASLRATVPPGGYWRFSNATTGAGNSSVIGNNTGQHLTLP
jgi:hypothetical protein